MKELINHNKYLEPEVIRQCFEQGVVHHVDKVVTGNGFTTGFANLIPRTGKINILIAPSQAVVKDKQNDYKRGKFGFRGARVEFVYQGQGLRKDVKDLDIIVFVVDSFVNFYWKIKGKIDLFLIDEFHSFYIQSDMRFKLKRALKLIKNIEDTAITYVSATPLLYTIPTIKIVNKYIDSREVYLSNNVQNSIARCVDKIEQGKRVLVFTNEAGVVKRIMNAVGSDRFNLISGDQFTTTLLAKGQYIIDPNSKIVIVSSTGHEGWSDYSNDGCNFFFTNINASHATFLGCNMAQALGRLRNGSTYDELCVVNIAGQGFVNNHVNWLEDKLDKFIENDKVPDEKKQGKNYAFRFNSNEVKGFKLHKYLHFEAEEGKLSIEKFRPAIIVHNEINRLDVNLSVYKKFFSDRKISFKTYDEEVSKTGVKVMLSEEAKVANIVFAMRNNEEYVGELFDKFFFKDSPQIKEDMAHEEKYGRTVEYFIKQIKRLIAVSDELERPLGLEIYALLEFYENSFQRGIHHTEINKIFDYRLGKKVMSDAKKRKERKEFKETGLIKAMQMAKQVVFKENSHHYVMHRDYNTFTHFGITIIKYISDQLKYDVVEVDIKNCFVRILYTLNDLDLPDNFYNHPTKSRGQMKYEINTNINFFFYDEKKNSSIKAQKQNARRKFRRYNFDDKVIDYMLENWFNTNNKGDLFNYLAHHEQNIIKKLKDDDFQGHNNLKEDDFYLIRRHDSVVIFSRNVDLSFDFLNDFIYLGKLGWFDRVKKAQISLLDNTLFDA